MYTLFRPLLFKMSPEQAHNAALIALRNNMLPKRSCVKSGRLLQHLWGLDFAHPIGLAAGFDKNAEAYEAIVHQGLAFIECGTVTPKPQEGNPKPRIFRLVEHEAVVNRLGFNNKGLGVFVRNLQSRKTGAVIAANIGKNKDSSDAIADYATCLNAVYAHADFITVNISSPNTPGLRDLQAEEALNALIKALHAARDGLIVSGHPHKPILVKIAPDLEGDAIAMIAQLALHHTLDGLIVSNTTITRPITGDIKAQWQTGGLSGKPLMALSTQTLAAIARATQGKIPLVGVGGIASAEDAYSKILHGASLVQLYTALIYQGFGMIPDMVQKLDTLLARDGFAHISEAVGKGL